MIIGIPKEIKNNEGRVGLDPKHVLLLVKEGVGVLIEKDAGELSGFSDLAYLSHGARIVSQKEVWEKSDAIIKVKEPLECEYQFLRPGLIVFAFFHFAGNPALKKACDETRVLAVPYEDFKDGEKKPVLAAMSVIAGEEAAEKARHYVKEFPGENLIQDAVVTIIGFGVAGRAAFAKLVHTYHVKKIAVIDKHLQAVTGPTDGKYIFLYYSEETVARALEDSDVVIGAALTPTGAPKLITRRMLRRMQPNSFFIDISVDEGGISPTSRPTSHDEPTYWEEGVLHYCVPNIPGVVPKRSTPALVESSFPFIYTYVQNMKCA